jgi:hypothetical protein
MGPPGPSVVAAVAADDALVSALAARLGDVLEVACAVVVVVEDIKLLGNCKVFVRWPVAGFHKMI